MRVCVCGMYVFMCIGYMCVCVHGAVKVCMYMNLYVFMHMYACRHQRTIFHIVPHRPHIASTLVLFYAFHFFS